MMRVVGMAVVMLASVAAHAQSYGGYPMPPQYQAQAPAPGQMLREGIEKITTYLAQGGSANPQRLLSFLESEVAPYFDFAYMARWAVGPRYRYLNPEQRSEVEQQLRDMFLGAMAEKLANYRPGRIQYLPPRGNPRRGEMVLSIRTYRADGYPMQLDFSLSQGRSGWRVYDVSANGASALMYYRKVFSQQPCPYCRR